MRDGASLAADVWLSKERAPAIVVMTPYDRTIWKRPLGGDYAWVVVDWRGFHGSKERKAERRKRGEDGFDTVEWTAAQPWCDGNVGMWGPSALGRIQYLTAMEQPPHLRCCVPVVASMGNRYEQYYWGGVLRQEYVDMFAKLGFNSAPAIREHRTHDAYWKESARHEGVGRIRVPMLLISGWYDVWVQGAMETFAALQAAAAAPHRLVVGPWGHYAVGRETQGGRRHPNAAGAAQAEAEAFFARHLLGETRTMATVRTYEIGSERWDDEMVGTESSVLPVRSESIVHDPLNPVRTIGGSNLDPTLGIGPYDQREILERPDVFVTAWSGTVRVSGRARLELAVRADGPFDLHARLCDGSMLICDTVQRCEGSPVVLTFPPVRIQTDRLRLVLAGSNHPRYELNPHAGRLEIVSGELRT